VPAPVPPCVPGLVSAGEVFAVGGSLLGLTTG
jgi:hypothetical protein